MTLNMPRVRGKVGQITCEDFGSPEEKKLAGKWSWLIEIYVVDRNAKAEVWKTIEGAMLEKALVYDSEAHAKVGLRAEVDNIVKIMQKAVGDPSPDGAYFDLKDGGYFTGLKE